MSVVDLKQYGQMIAEQDEVRQHAKEIGIEHLDEQMAYAKELGLEFTLDDMQALAEEAGMTEDELSEEQLEQIAGGVLSSTGVVAIVVAGGLAAIAGACVTGFAVGLGAGAAAVSKAW